MPSTSLTSFATTTSRWRSCVLPRNLGAGAALALLLAPQPGLAQQAPDPPPVAGAPISKVECARAFEQSQRLRNSSRYLEANAEVLKCTSPSCGPALSEECGKIYGELQEATPSIVPAARDAAGHELTNVSMLVDDAADPIALDGKPVPIDPGNHTLAFSADGFKTQAQQVVVRAGERLRAISVVLERDGLATSPSASSPVAADSTPRAQPGKSGPPLASYVLGGLGVLGFGGFVAFRVWGAHDFDALARDCKPTCSRDAVDGVRQKYLFSNIALAVGGAASIAAVTVYLAAPKDSTKAASLQVWQSGGGVSARLTTHF